MVKKYGKDINGILLLDKPQGFTSNTILQSVKRLFQANKVGHSGSLDPLATGMLPLCFGESAKFSRFLLESNKCYQTTICLGISTSTGDSMGEMIASHPVPSLSAEILRSIIVKFQGSLVQTPPMYSAIKQNGQPLYRLARQGKSVPRQSRQILIQQLSIDKVITESERPSITLTVVCSKGTYIRTLAEDIGAFLGCGAHVTALRRLWVSPFQDLPMRSIDDLEKISFEARESVLIATQKILSLFFPMVEISERLAPLLLKGQSVSSLSNVSAQGWVGIMTSTGEFLGVGEIKEDGLVVPKRLIQTGSGLNAPDKSIQ